jgi:hypothetical protein
MKLFDKLPHYRSHKTVAAAQVLTAATDEGSKFWDVTLEGIAGSHSIPKARVPEGRDPVGGMMVVYSNQDGSEYVSWCPAGEFVANNSLLIGEGSA